MEEEKDLALERFAAALERAAGESLEDPPAALLERAARIARESPRPGGREASWSLARLVQTVLPPPALAGIRGETPRTLVFESDEGRVHLEVGEDPEDAERWRITGQLEMPEAPASEALALLWAEGAMVSHAVLDRVGVFVLPRVSSGRYRLELWAPETATAVRLDRLDVPPQESS